MCCDKTMVFGWGTLVCRENVLRHGLKVHMVVVSKVPRLAGAAENMFLLSVSQCSYLWRFWAAGTNQPRQVSTLLLTFGRVTGGGNVTDGGLTAACTLRRMPASPREVGGAVGGNHRSPFHAWGTPQKNRLPDSNPGPGTAPAPQCCDAPESRA